MTSSVSQNHPAAVEDDWDDEATSEAWSDSAAESDGSGEYGTLCTFQLRSLA